MSVVKEEGMCVGNRALLLRITRVRKLSFKILLLEISIYIKVKMAKISNKVYKFIITKKGTSHKVTICFLLYFLYIP